MTGGIGGVPPGRTGRLWLQRRLDTAHRGATLLDRKLRLLLAEQGRLRTVARRTQQEWEARYAEANRWALRAALLSGQRAIMLAASRNPAEVTIRYSLAAGTRYPSEATCAMAESDVFCTATIAAARRTCREAVAAAVRHAAAAQAVRVVDAEAGATRYRLRAIEDRWIPRLEHALTEVELGLEELEHADGVRIRQVLNRRKPRVGGDQSLRRPVPKGSRPPSP